MNRTNGLVSVGVPVMNGGATIRLAVESILHQTYTDLEIIISDNCSSDDTEDACRELVASDSRIRYVRQPQRLTALENFRYVFEQSTGEYFMWAAHDDLRSANYAEVLVQGARVWPDASIIFTDTMTFSDYENHTGGAMVEYKCDTRGLDQRGRHLAQARGHGFHLYGLMKPTYLEEYSWADFVYGADDLLLHWLLYRGDFVYVPGASLYYYRPVVDRTIDEVSLSVSYKRAGRFWRLGYAWTCAGVVRPEARRTGERAGRLGLAMLFYQCVSGGVRHTIYRMSPRWMTSIWGAIKRVRVIGMGL